MSWDNINNIYTYISVIYIKIYICISILLFLFFSSKIGQFYNCNEMWQAVHFWGIIACLECIRQKEEYLTSDTKEVEPSTRNALEWSGTSYCFYKTRNYTLVFMKRHKIKGESNISLFSGDQRPGSSVAAHWTLFIVLNLFPVVQYRAAVA